MKKENLKININLRSVAFIKMTSLYYKNYVINYFAKNYGNITYNNAHHDKKARLGKDVV